MTILKRYPFTNDYVFKKTLSTNKHITQKIIKIITGNDVTVDQIQKEVVIDPNKEAPSVRYDVYLLTNNNSIYDLEMQTYKNHNLVLRSRYYVSANDIDYETKYQQLNKKFTYYDLPTIYIIFICTFDPFKENGLMYLSKEIIFVNKFDKENIIKDYKNEIYANKVTKIFINASKSSQLSYNEIENKDLVNLINYIVTDEPCDKLTKDINNCVNKINEHDRGEIMTYQDHFDEMEEYFRREGKEEGLKEGKETTLIATIKLLKTSFSNVNDLYNKLISVDEFKSLSLDKVKEIYNNI